MTQRLYCNGGCADSYHEDRRQGMIYGGMLFLAASWPRADATAHKRHIDHTHHEDGISMGWNDATRIIRACRYCQADLS